MALSTLALDSSWRDYYAMWNPLIEPLHAPIEESVCHAPRYALIPDVQHQTIPASGKIEYNFYFDVTRNDSGIEGAVPVDLYFRFIGIKVFER